MVDIWYILVERAYTPTRSSVAPHGGSGNPLCFMVNRTFIYTWGCLIAEIARGKVGIIMTSLADANVNKWMWIVLCIWRSSPEVSPSQVGEICVSSDWWFGIWGLQKDHMFWQAVDMLSTHFAPSSLSLISSADQRDEKGYRGTLTAPTHFFKGT